MVVAMKEVNNRWLKILLIFSKVEVFLIFHNVTNFPTFFPWHAVKIKKISIHISKVKIPTVQRGDTTCTGGATTKTETDPSTGPAN